MASPFIQGQAKLLTEGTEGTIVLANLRAHFNTFTGYEKSVSKVRREYLRLGHRHSMYDTDLNQLEEQCHIRGLDDLFAIFQRASLMDQYDMLYHDRCFPFCELRLLPENVLSLRLNPEEVKLARQTQQSTLTRRNFEAVHVPKSFAFLQAQIALLETGHPHAAVEILACLFVSGRREAELLNGKSTFVPVSSFHVRFEGVLKKKRDCGSVCIPLLCHSSLFIRALARLRDRQKNDVPTLTNAEVSKRYSGPLSRAQKIHMPFLSKVHDLRGVYARFVDLMFDHTSSFPFVCMHALAHDAIQDCLHYSNIVLEEAQCVRRDNGPLILNDGSGDAYLIHGSGDA